MSYHIHRTVNIIIRRDVDLAALEKIRLRCRKLFVNCQISDTTQSAVNDYVCITVCTSGSKQGWPEQEDHDEAIDQLFEYLKKYLNDDNSSSVMATVTDINDNTSAKDGPLVTISKQFPEKL